MNNKENSSLKNLVSRKNSLNFLIVLTIYAIFGMIKVLAERRNADGVVPLYVS